ncbi:MAG: hypothetical protein ABSD31_12725 [Candidatus Binataceae bacterium]|jgi:hypothetical protein
MLSNGWKILPEHTTLKLLPWDVPVELRFAQLSAREPNDTGDFFENIEATQILDYPHFDIDAGVVTEN